MALPGPAGKAVKHGRTPSADWTDVPDVPFTGPSPDLPPLPNRRKWQEIVQQWWAQVRQMPHCAGWTAGDWQFAIETAYLKDAFWRDYHAGEAKGNASTEIRRREAQMGTTTEARRQLRIRYTPVAEVSTEEPGPQSVVEEQEYTGTGATVTPITDRRTRLTQQQRTA